MRVLMGRAEGDLLLGYGGIINSSLLWFTIKAEVF